MRAILKVAIGWGLVLLLADVAVAADTEDEIIRRGIELRKAGDDLGASVEFKKAYRMTGSPRAAAQLGLAEQALGRWDEAEVHVTEALKASGDAWIRKNRVALEQASTVIKSHVARIEIVSDPEGAEAVVNGKSAGRLPLSQPLAVSAGEIDVEVRAAGYERSTRRIVLTGGQYQRMVFRLERLEDRRPPTVARSAAAERPESQAAETSKAGADVETESTEAGESEVSGITIAKWSALGLGVAALATGVVAAISKGKSVDSLDKRGCYDMNGVAVDMYGRPDADCQRYLNSSERLQMYSIIGFAAAGAFAVTWAVLMIVDAKSRPPASVARWTCHPGVGQIGLGCATTF